MVKYWKLMVDFVYKYLFTKPQDKEYLDIFYNDLKRPVLDDEELTTDVI